RRGLVDSFQNTIGLKLQGREGGLLLEYRVLDPVRVSGLGPILLIILDYLLGALVGRLVQENKVLLISRHPLVLFNKRILFLGHFGKKILSNYFIVGHLFIEYNTCDYL